jgi:hypothetical protein
MSQSWFEMQDLRKRKLDSSVWIPLRAEKEIRNTIKFGLVGYSEEFIGYGSVMVPVNKKSFVEKLSWNDIGIRHTHSCSFHNDRYIPSDIYYNNDFEGVNLVLNQSFDNNLDYNDWHLHQDLTINLGLKREADIWVCPKEGYVEVAKLERDEDGNPKLLQIKNQFLKDYLCARECGLYVTSYFIRDKIYDNPSVLSWKEESKKAKEGRDFWECRIMEIHKGGFPFGQKIAVSHIGRTDIDENEDIPNITFFPTDENVKSEFYEKSFQGEKLYRIMSELWKYEWINPAKISPIVLGDEQPIDIYYITDVDGRKESGNDLRKGGKWLWFKPELISSLLSNRGSFLNWYTRDTGSVSCAPDGDIHFGVNDLGLITVYAKDIGYLPKWQQQIWAGFNIAPEGGISKELHASQVRAEPASTLAPEAFIGKVIKEINEETKKQLNIRFFREHHSVSDIIHSINRFRAIDEKGLFSLAKDIARIIVDDIDVESIQKIAIPQKDKKWGSLKTIENLLAIKISPENAKKISSPFVGVYELRHGDAHLPSSNIENSFDLIQIDRNLPYVMQGYQMIYTCVDNLHIVLRILEKWNKKS